MGELKYHSCPRCKKGDVAMDKDYYGWYEDCVQCGYTRDLDSMGEPYQRQNVTSEKRRKSAKVVVGKK